MPHSFRVYKTLRAAGFDEDHSLAIAGVIETAREYPSVYKREIILDSFCDCGISEGLADSLADVLRNCFLSERFSTNFARIRLKTQLVRAGIRATNAERLLEAIESCVVTPRNAEVRVPIRYAPRAGRVIMCDFTFLVRPEMQKERRAIVVSVRSATETGRCAVVPVSMSPPREKNQHYFEFPAGSYPFFHPHNPVWAICDHVYTVGLGRLWRVNVDRKPALPSLTDADLESVRELVGTALGISVLTSQPGDITSPAHAEDGINPFPAGRAAKSA